MSANRSSIAERLRVRVPASTSNLGPGFDLLGLALSLWLDAAAEPSSSAGIELAIEGGEAAAWPRGADNVLVRAFDLAWRRCGGRGEPRVRLRARSEIPVGRGLGSSGAAIAAGLLLGRAAASSALEGADLLRWGVELEGHPDNVAAALAGGCTLTVPLAGRAPRVVRQAVHPALGFSVAWPRATLDTSFARRLLPEQVARGDAVENARRLALLLEGLRCGDPELIALGGEDRLHVPHRLPHIPGGARALDAARGAGAWLATISGAGSALVAIAPRERRGEVAEAMRVELDRASPPAEARALELVDRAPQVERAG